jgi:hypothetical protein
MFRGARSFAIAFAVATGACSMPMSELMLDLIPGNGAAPFKGPKNVAVCTQAAQMLAGASKLTITSAAVVRGVNHADLFSMRMVSARIQLFKQRVLHPALQTDPVVEELFRAVGTTIYQSHLNTVQLSRSLSNPIPIDSAASTFGQPRDLNYTDFMSFATTLRRVTLESSATHSIASPLVMSDLTISREDVAISQAQFNKAFTFYFNEYFNGRYVDRFGTRLPAPNSLQTINDNEISGTLQVFLELIMDYALQTPVWRDKQAGRYYPGNGSDAKNRPTVVAAYNDEVMPLQMMTILPASSSQSCGITPLKAEAIQYIAQTAGNRASALGGQVGGSFGGINIGLGVLGKLSIGDNKTLHSLVTTALQKTFTRAGEEASYRVLYWIPYNRTDRLVDLIQKYLDAQVGGSSGS